MNNAANSSANSDDMGEDLVVIRQNPQQQQQQQHVQQNVQTPTSSAAASTYDTSKAPPAITTNSAFTPIQAMPPHLNASLAAHHHQQLAAASQRPSYLYDAINFQNQKQVVGNAAAAAAAAVNFPNQLISLHQIRNYAHQPSAAAAASGLIAGEHLLGMGKSEKQ